MSQCEQQEADEHRLPTGIAGLDALLGGGLQPNRAYLVEGDPGGGKTTLAMQFVMQCDPDEHCMYVTLSESEEELRASANSHGWDLGNLSIVEIIPSEAAGKADGLYTMYHPFEVELGAVTKRVLDVAEKTKPALTPCGTGSVPR